MAQDCTATTHNRFAHGYVRGTMEPFETPGGKLAERCVHCGATYILLRDEDLVERHDRDENYIRPDVPERSDQERGVQEKCEPCSEDTKLRRLGTGRYI